MLSPLFLLLCAPSHAATELSVDVCIVGGGSGGMGAAIAAARGGAKTLLIEKQARLGGTSTQAYVCNWEPGPGGELARELYERLAKRPHAVGMVKECNADRKLGPFGLWLLDPESTYDDTLRRAGMSRTQQRACVFDPQALHEVVSEILVATGNCQVLLNTTFTEAEVEGRRLTSIVAAGANGQTYRLRARTFIDCTGGAHLCRAVGCETMLGPEPRSRFGEPSAAEKPEFTLNALSLCYRVRRSEHPVRAEAPTPAPTGWQRVAHVSQSPHGDLLVNPLATLPGEALLEKGYEAALTECRRRQAAHWHWLQGFPTLADYELESVAPMLGIRESYRVVGEYVLRQQDLMAGLAKQTAPDLIAVADHSMDVHGSGGKRIHGELSGPYGVPFRCLIPRGWQNLLVACRGASFSQIAASSCRLSRTMIQLGRAAGTAAALAAAQKCEAREVDPAMLRRLLFSDPSHPIHKAPGSASATAARES